MPFWSWKNQTKERVMMKRYRLKKIVFLATLSNESFAKLTVLPGPTTKVRFFMQFVLDFFVGQIDMGTGQQKRFFQVFRRLHEMHTPLSESLFMQFRCCPSKPVSKSDLFSWIDSIGQCSDIIGSFDTNLCANRFDVINSILKMNTSPNPGLGAVISHQTKS